MYNIGDMVLYGGEGICRITSIEDKKIADRVIKYYVLTPESSGNSVFYVPMEGKAAEAKIRKIISGKEIRKIINETASDVWEDNDRVRRDIYNGAVNCADREKIVALVKCCILHKEKLSEEGKRLHKVDEYFLSEVEKLLYGEFKNVFEIERDEIIPFIIGQCEVKDI